MVGYVFYSTRACSTMPALLAAYPAVCAHCHIPPFALINTSRPPCSSTYPAFVLIAESLHTHSLPYPAIRICRKSRLSHHFTLVISHHCALVAVSRPVERQFCHVTSFFTTRLITANPMLMVTDSRLGWPRLRNVCGPLYELAEAIYAP